MIVFKIALAVVIIGVIYHFATRKYVNPYKLYMVFGKKGCGKTTLLAKLAYRYQRAGRPVYCTEPVRGTYKLDAKNFCRYELPPGSVVLIDEAGMCYDNRKFKTFPDFVRDWYKLQRHRHLIVYLFSQDFDIDLKLRQLTDEMYLCRKYFRVFSVERRISRNIVINKSSAEAPSNIADNLEFVPIIYPGAIKITFIPRWTKYFDSFSAPPLEPSKPVLWFPPQKKEADASAPAP
mgnify:CR=1 FL=1